jgi:PBP1b-binding outer membrane lipoprotein LpoB
MKHFTKICEMAIVLSLLLVGCNNSLQPSQNSSATPRLDLSPQTNTPFAKTPTITPIPTSTLHAALDAESANKLAL